MSGLVLGGSYNGLSSKQTVTSKRDSEGVINRRVVRDSWNTPYATGTYNGNKRVITPFRAVNNLGDFLSRQNYVCGGPNQVNASKPGMKSKIGSMIMTCDSKGVPASSCNTKFVSDSSDYVRFKKQRATNHNYNDSAN